MTTQAGNLLGKLKTEKAAHQFITDNITKHVIIPVLDEYTIDDNILIQSYVYSQRVCKQKLHSASNSIIKTYYLYLYEFI